MKKVRKQLQPGDWHGITAVGPVMDFKADHPFVYISAEKQTGTILFNAILRDPSKN